MIISRKRFHEEVQKRLFEEEQRRDQRERFERIDRRLAELEMQMFDVRMKADPEFRKRNTPTCSCGTEG